MEVTSILAEIDAQISKLQQARALLAGTGSTAPSATKKKVGRPRKNPEAATVAKTPKKRRKLSADARKRIADAQKRRWAESRKSAA